MALQTRIPSIDVDFLHKCVPPKDGGLLTPPGEDIIGQILPVNDSQGQVADGTSEQHVIVAVIGVGYVGMHLIMAFSSVYHTIAFDINESRIREVQESVGPRGVHCTSDPRRLVEATHFLIAVSTNVRADRTIDTSCIRQAVDMICMYGQPGATVVIESSVAVGMTRNLLGSLQSTKGFKCGMSPERVDPGRTYPTFTSIPKLVSGLDQSALEAIEALYARVFTHLVPVSSPEVAEMTKLYENCQRMMCIAFANEMADACRAVSFTPLGKETEHATRMSHGDCRDLSMRIDPWEVSKAAATKPFGYQPYWPSLGVGGHCIPVNPHYLLSNASFPLLEAATDTMRSRPMNVGDLVMGDILSKQRLPNEQVPRLLVVGVGFKKGQSVLSNSPGRDLAVHLLSSYNAYVAYADPLVAQEEIPGIPRLDHTHEWTHEHLRTFDAIIVAVVQPGLDLRVLTGMEEECDSRILWYCDKP